uniref:Isocitrate dehydrogenase n=1 Tax=Rhizophora mucronata TaxID=61149 RepID=A0A2P2KAL1_RHIMU
MASMTCSTALVTNGPMPSPGMRVTARGAPSPGRGM